MTLPMRFYSAVLLTLLAAPLAHATDSDPLPGAAVAPPANVNILLFSNLWTNAGAYGAPHGAVYDRDTKISADASVVRYVHTFELAGIISGVQAYADAAESLGAQQLGIRDIPSPAPGRLPAYGAGRSTLSTASGFGQPNFGVFAYPVNDPRTGTYLVIAPWISPPVSSFNKNDSLNISHDDWSYELETGFRTVLWGRPAARNLAIEIWGDAYFYLPNRDSAYVMPEVSADDIPAIDTLAHARDRLIPDSNPLRAASTQPARFSEQTSEALRIYLPYTILPAYRFFAAPGFYQSFGGKQLYTLDNGKTVDSGVRTNETQLRLVTAAFVAPTVQLMLIGEYDLAARGAALNRAVEFRIAKVF